jgi:hypothetical protein
VDRLAGRRIGRLELESTTARLHEEMLTVEGRRIARERTTLMEEFLASLMDELGGEPLSRGRRGAD